jgi:hypothetical protein
LVHAVRPPAGAPEVLRTHAPAELQVLHCEVHVDSQHTPSTQWPVPH